LVIVSHFRTEVIVNRVQIYPSITVVRTPFMDIYLKPKPKLVTTGVAIKTVAVRLLL